MERDAKLQTWLAECERERAWATGREERERLAQERAAARLLSADYAAEQRERAILVAKARMMSVKDAIAQVTVYNRFQLGPKPKPPTIELHEVLPHLPEEELDKAILAVERMITATSISYPGDDLELIKEKLRTDHPGFSDESFDRALHLGFFTMR